MGNIESDALQPINISINSFMVQCRKNLIFLEKFGSHVDRMDAAFNASWCSDTNLNNFFFDYEKDVLTDYLISLNNHPNKKGIKGLVQQQN
jgi:hypothetical protein